MKHSLKITILLGVIFLVSQVVGLVTVSQYININIIDGKKIIEHPETVLGEAPEIENKSMSFLPLILTILAGTALIFVLIHFRLGSIWKYWFLFAVVLTMAVSFGVYINPFIGFVLALILGLIKVFKPNVIVHNFTEIFIYTGITIAILPFLNLFSAFMMLVLISIYDAIAVWKSKHMIKLAEFQTESKVFAGLLIPYGKGGIPKANPGKGSKTVKVKVKRRSAILGGGDIAFPLLFSAVVMQHLIEIDNFSKIMALNSSFIITITTTIALFGLLLYGKKDRFYPAMPFISLGCFIGYGIILLIF